MRTEKREMKNANRRNEAIEELIELILTETCKLHQLHQDKEQVNYKGVI